MKQGFALLVKIVANIILKYSMAHISKSSTLLTKQLQGTIY